MQKNNIKYYLITSLLVLLLASFLGYIRNIFLDKNFPKFTDEPKTEKIKIDLMESDELLSFMELAIYYGESSIVEVDIIKTYNIFLNNKNISTDDEYRFTFVDAREEEKFELSHIEGSINIPFNSENQYDNSLLDSIKYQNLLIYCNDSKCTLGYDLAEFLVENKGFSVIFYFKDGYDGWLLNELPIKKVDKQIDRKFNLIENLNGEDILIILSLLLILLFYFNSKYKKYIPTIGKLLLAYIFISFSYDKILDPIAFAKSINNYDILSSNLLIVGSLILPWIEMIVGLILLISSFKLISIKSPSLTDTSAIIISLLLIMFILMILIAYINGKSIECGCKLDDSLGSFEKRFNMVKRMLIDLYLLFLALIVKYRYNFLNKYV